MTHKRGFESWLHENTNLGFKKRLLKVENQNVFARSESLRVAMKNEDDCHGPAPMEVGAMKGKKGDRQMHKRKYGKSFGKQRVQQKQPVQQRQ